MYSYRASVESDVREWMMDNEEEWKDVNLGVLSCFLSDRLFCEDSVTGNASGSYTMSRYIARCNVMGDEDSDDIITEMVDEGILDTQTLGEWYSSQNWEAIDVVIRCHLLDEIISGIVSEIADERGTI